MTYLLNTWYAAAWSECVGEALLPITLLDPPVVLFRAGGVRAGRVLARLIAEESASPTRDDTPFPPPADRVVGRPA